MRIAVAGLCLLLAGLLSAQGTKADYERADNLGARFRGKVRNADLVPHWFEGKDRFWYRRDLGEGRREYRLVDAAAGTNEVLFDHAAVAAEIGRKDATRLTLRAAQASPRGLALWLDGFDEALVVESAGATRRRPLEEVEAWRLAARPRAPRSGRGRGRSYVLFVNRGEHPAEYFWVDGDGGERSYGTVPPGGSSGISTFAGHSWRIAVKGKTWGGFVAEDEARVALIGRKKPSASRPKRNQKRRRNAGPARPYRIIVRDHDLYLAPRNGEDETLLSDVGEEGFAFSGRADWSPDGRYAVVRRTRRASRRQVTFVESTPRDQPQPRTHTFSYVKPGDTLDRPTLWLVDARRARATEIDPELYPNPWSVNRIHWDEDSTGFRFVYNERGHGRLRVVRVRARDARARVVIDEDPDTFVDYAGKFFLESGKSDRELVWMSERSGWNHLYRVDARSGKVLNAITEGPWMVRGVDRVDRDKGQVWFHAGGIRPDEDPYHLHYCRVDLDGKNLVVLTEGDGTHTVSYAPSGEFFVDRWSRVDLPPRSVLRRSADGKKMADLEIADVSELRAAGWRPPERFVAKGRDGQTDIWGIIHRPTSFEEGRRYPVVEQIYAGPHGAHVPKGFRVVHGAQSTAELGFVVVQIDGMGTSQRSKAFHDVCWKNLGDAGFLDRIAWMRAAAKNRPEMDLERVGIYGGSAGGQNAMRALIAHHEFYDVAIADCGCHDNRMDKIWWNELWMSWPIGPHYAESSNVDQAHRVKGDLLLIVGEVDRNVDPASTMQVVDALVRADKDFDLLVIPGAGHGAAGTAYGRRRQRDYLVRKLWGEEPRR